MKNKIFYGIFIVTLLVVLGISVNKGLTNKSDISDLVLNNVEALAQSEDPVEVFFCNTQVLQFVLFVMINILWLVILKEHVFLIN